MNKHCSETLKLACKVSTRNYQLYHATLSSDRITYSFIIIVNFYFFQSMDIISVRDV